MIRQVLMDDVTLTNNDPTMATEVRVLAFGTHPLADAPDSEVTVRPAENAKAIDQDLRIVIDELLVGNYLEEVRCRGFVDDDIYSRVPIKATPDDIARCSAPNDILPRTCAADATAMCICQNDAGCVRDTDMVAKGQPVGVDDKNEDGGADDTQLIAGSVGIRCNDSIEVPIEQNASFWNPSGDQNKPAEGGFERLGPAIVLAPDGPIPTNSDCVLTFSDEVVDKQGIRPCTPPGGDIAQSCTPGDVSGFSFHSENMFIDSTFNGAVLPTDTPKISLVANTYVAMSSLSNITMTENGNAFSAFTVMLKSPTEIEILFDAALAAGATYVVTIPVTVTDIFGRPLVQALTYMFTTT